LLVKGLGAGSGAGVPLRIDFPRKWRRGGPFDLYAAKIVTKLGLQCDR
jgi:hypothetical protein